MRRPPRRKVCAVEPEFRSKFRPQTPGGRPGFGPKARHLPFLRAGSKPRWRGRLADRKSRAKARPPRPNARPESPAGQCNGDATQPSPKSFLCSRALHPAPENGAHVSAAWSGAPRVDQVIRENPASRGTETSAEVLVGPPLGAGGWSETPVNSSGTRLTLALGGGLEGPLRPAITPYPFPSAS